MISRLAIHDWITRYALNPNDQQRLWQLADFRREPDDLLPLFMRALAIVAGGLVGLGVIYWVAAHWDSLGRLGRLLLLQGLLLGSGIGACYSQRARVGLIFLMVLTVGGLLAVFGQTYQTGADTWQLFALWTALALPLALAARHDAVWGLWVVVAHVALLLWARLTTGFMGPTPLATTMTNWLLATGIVVAVSPWPGRWTGAGLFSYRLALTGSLVYPLFDGITDLFDLNALLVFGIAVAVTGVLSGLQALRRKVDLYALSATMLVFDLLLVAGLGKLLGHWGWRDAAILFTMGCFTMALLAVSVTLTLRLHRAHAEAHHA